jgi:hypothetical protein
MRIFPYLLAIFLFGACAKRAPMTVAGGDDEQFDQYTAQLEELRSRPFDDTTPCRDRCSLARDVCALSGRICEISGRQPDRPEMQQRCVQSQEDCARFNDGCAGCN